MANKELDRREQQALDALRAKRKSRGGQKKVDQAKPLSMQEALRARLARRNDAISGKSDKESRKRDSLVIQEARSSIIAQPMMQSSDNKPKPPPPPASKQSSLLKSIGFADYATK